MNVMVVPCGVGPGRLPGVVSCPDSGVAAALSVELPPLLHAAIVRAARPDTIQVRMKDLICMTAFSKGESCWVDTLEAFYADNENVNMF
jgi:hypothetical protein